MGAGALGWEGLRRGRRCHAWLRPGEAHDDEEPDECQQDALGEKMRWDHGVVPSRRGEMGALYAVVETWALVPFDVRLSRAILLDVAVV